MAWTGLDRIRVVDSGEEIAAVLFPGLASSVELPAWPSRVQAVVAAFAMHAAELERTTVDLVEGLGDAMSKGRR